jgi:putative heme-binding domain-containing protein
MSFRPRPMKAAASFTHIALAVILAASLPSTLVHSVHAEVHPVHSEDPSAPLDVLVQTLGKIENPAVQANILRGMNTSLRGRHVHTAPQDWPALYEKLKSSPSESVRQQAQELSAVFGGSAALEELRKKLTDTAAPTEARLSAMDTLLSAQDPQTLPILVDQAKQPGPIRDAALRGLASYEDAHIPAAIIDSFKTFDSNEKRDALNTLLGRPESARALLSAIDAKTLDRSVITAPIARQLQNLRDPEIDTWMGKNWGAVRTSPADKQKEIARLKKSLDTYSILHADASRGRAIFTQTCAICHTLFGYGAKIGPELPGSFADVDYLLLNIVDPNAIIGKDYQQTFIHMKDGRTVSGIIASDDPAAVTLKTLAGPVTVQHADIASTEISPNSLMPEGLLSALDEGTVRDLFLYLRQKSQIPILATETNAGDFFNGNDLSRWRPSSDHAWKVENGEIIGHSEAGKSTWLKSEMIARDFKLTASIKLTGSDPIAEIAFQGRPDQTPFVGTSLSLGGPSELNLWHYAKDAKPIRSGTAGIALEPGKWAKLSITSKSGQITLGIDYAQWTFTPPLPTSDRNGFAIYLQGANSELHLKDLKLETDTK